MSLRDDYYRKCATCYNYPLLNPAACNNVGFRCTKYGKYYTLDDTCTHYSWNRNVSDSNLKDAEKMIDKKRNSSWWYLTTAITTIIGYKKNNYYVRTLERIKDEYLLKDLTKLWILVKYDMLGHNLANALYNDSRKEEYAEFFFVHFIVPISKEIENGNIELAAVEYFDMINDLEVIFPLETNYTYDTSGISLKMKK